MIGTGRNGLQDGWSSRPDTAPMAANRSDMVQASWDAMTAPSENPVAYTREVSMHWVAST